MFTKNKTSSKWIDISEIIGQSIIDLRFKLDSDIDGLDYFQTFITLSSKIMIGFPYLGSAPIVNPKGKLAKLSKEHQKLLIGFAIVDIYEPYFDDKPDESEMPFIQLSNGIFINEVRIFPHGSGNANLWLYDREEFKGLLAEKNSMGCNLKSFTGGT